MAPKERRNGAPRARRTAQDDSIMATNNSSIVSKRSVEKLYYPEPHFFRYFVNKPQRRSPLINRGYWLRMYAVEHVVRTFLAEPAEKNKVIINLGCGYDPLAFQFLAHSQELCGNTTFIDVDYPQLIEKKARVIRDSPPLSDLLGEIHVTAEKDLVQLRSSSYYALGCDLRDLERLSSILQLEHGFASCMILLVAEVSVTYMDVGAADALIAWASHLENARFCLLEQYLPNGPEHPFAETMLKHFEKLQTPLRSVHTYPTLDLQRKRFTSNGWSSVTVRNLWDLWASDSFLTVQQRSALDLVEPFDEWEELALFGTHYFLLVAATDKAFNHLSSQNATETTTDRYPCLNDFPKLDLIFSPSERAQGQRKYGATTAFGQDTFIHHGGQGHLGRLHTDQLYTSGNIATLLHTSNQPATLRPRMCHTITSIESGCLLVGGRCSPDDALPDCWIRRDESWRRVDDLPMPLYRHCSTKIKLPNGVEGVLIYGGKSRNDAVRSEWHLWRDSTGWTTLKCQGETAVARFGASMATLTLSQGILLGGMSEDGRVLQEAWEWSIIDEGVDLMIQLRNISREFNASSMSFAAYRFGACLIWSPLGFLLIGGIMHQTLLSRECEIIGLAPSHESRGKVSLKPHVVHGISGDFNPLLVGHSAVSLPDEAIIVGGGAVCFSFGAFWNSGVWALRNPGFSKARTWHLLEPSAPFEPKSQQQPDVTGTSSPQRGSVLRVKLDSQNSFQRVINDSRPAVIKDLDLGPCTKLWDSPYLKAIVGPNRSVVIHDADSTQMDFQSKNFRYTTVNFGEFLDGVVAGDRTYLRSLASDKPSERAANIEVDFPELAKDFKLPEELQLVKKNIHSSVLRITGQVRMWLHYDVMANVLCQVRGSKRIVLYPPSDIMHLGMAPGASSSSIDVFEANHPWLCDTHAQETMLRPGDVLFIPPLWLHATSPLEGMSIAVNVFFRNLSAGYAAGRDVYGNRDLQAYEKGRKDLHKLVKAFDGLPPDVGRFYLERLAGELREQALALSPRS